MAGKKTAKKNVKKQENKVEKKETVKIEKAPQVASISEAAVETPDANAVIESLGAVNTTIAIPEEKTEVVIIPETKDFPNITEEISKSEKELEEKMQGKPEEALEFVKEEIKKAENLEKKIEAKQKEIQAKTKTPTVSFTSRWNGVDFGY